MNNLKLIGLYLLFILFTSCNRDEVNLHGEFEFIAEYSTTVITGGFVGIAERTFKIGEVYKGTDKGEATIRIRIAEHTKLNEDCPKSWCYQEFIEVPNEFLKFVK
ncbi:hypothetical protein [Carboxylicivirga sp. M1479]|uniref:hypothetical protein n=1 Tax=Carboxylicivirga sp. M1479 TaxID=2594476 RepID=UPI00117885B9|nr:hypothetical protein [Carboxylicivirga sp. M1479]TRX71537.1 hypothetical protein FNN09_06080 [Carboxylicivirga sp. M1479]